MIKSIILVLSPANAVNEEAIKQNIAAECAIGVKRISGYKILKRSIDSRAKQIKIILSLQVFIDEEIPENEYFKPKLDNVAKGPFVIIIGAGPAGLFAAFKLISLGIKPVILERGKDVRSRRIDIAKLNRQGIVNPESNYCFGEGGAGTYSDGKLYTRATKRGNVSDILKMFTYFGASPEIMYEAHPHIGTNKLPQIIIAMRNQILDCGGEIYFEKRVSDLLISGDKINGVKCADGTIIKCGYVILATGHSAKDIFTLLNNKGIKIECKPFALGVRIEHPQYLIDNAQYHCKVKDNLLPPASYSFVTQANGKGVFSFCMCPGGIIAPAATDEGEIVVNGWSPSKRNNLFANSGTVVTVDEQDFLKYKCTGPLAALQYRQMVEQKAYTMGGGNMIAPAQRMEDFIAGRQTVNLPTCSYHPGVNSVILGEVLPIEITKALKKGIIDFGKKMKGYYTNEAIIVATESRTSSPVRIPRNKETLQHIQISGLYPCAEGAGYAGGIISAAIDGERCAEAIYHDMKL